MKRLLYIALLLLILPAIAFSRQDDSITSRRLISLMEAAERHEPKALYTLASLLEEGREGLARDTAEALRLYREAADSLYAPAMSYLGYSYMKGNSLVEADADSALYWTQRAAEAGYPAAFNNLGWMLLNPPSGIKKDERKALYWLGKAADAGNGPALSTLGEIALEKGDTVAATSGLRKALEHGFTPASASYEELMADSLQRMSAADLLTEAQRFYTRKGAPAFALTLLEKYLPGETRDGSDESDQLDCADRAASAVDRAAYGRGLAMLAFGHAQGIIGYDYDLANELFYRASKAGDPAAAFILAETLEMQPDLFAPSESGKKDRLSESGQYADRLSEEERVPEYWREKARLAGVTTAREAISLLSPH